MSQNGETLPKTVLNETEFEHHDAENNEPLDLLIARSSPDGEESDSEFVEEVPNVPCDSRRVIPRRSNPRRLTSRPSHYSPTALQGPRMFPGLHTNRERTPRQLSTMSLPPSRDRQPRCRGLLSMIQPVMVPVDSSDLLNCNFIQIV